MSYRFILTPYYLDDRVVGFEPIVGADWQINEASLPAGPRQLRMATIYKPLADFVADTIAEGETPVSFAGDCCSTLGVLAGLQRAGVSPTLIWLDAHGDFNTWETTPSGFLGGMPLAMLVGRGEPTMAHEIGLTPHPEAQVILSDARDLDPGEKEAVAASDMIHLRDVAELLDYPLPDGPLYVHFDIDVIRPEEVSATNYLAPGGPSVGILGRVFRRIAQTGQLVALSVSALNPALDEDGRSQAAVMGLLDAFVA
ncbi:MAG: arginase family protein [Ardenticatenaceae bacterium]